MLKFQGTNSTAVFFYSQGGILDQNPPTNSAIFQVLGFFDQLYLHSEIKKKGVFSRVYHKNGCEDVI